MTRHRHSPNEIQDLVEAIIAIHPRPDLASEYREEIALALASEEPVRIDCGGSPMDSIGIEPLVIKVRERTYRLSPSISGLHRVLPEDPNALERLRGALERRHMAEGTILPRGEQVRRDHDATGIRYVYDVPGDVEPLAIPYSQHQTDADLEIIASEMIRNAEGRRREMGEIRRSDRQVEKVVTEALRGTGAKVLSIKRKGITFTPDIIIYYQVRVRGLSSVLKPEESELAVRRLKKEDAWEIHKRAAYAKEQKARHARWMESGGGAEGLKVDTVMCRCLQRVENRAPLRHIVFSLSQGQEHSRIEIAGIQNAKSHNGRIIGLVPIAPGVTWRDGELRLKNRILPETVLSGIEGLPIDRLIESDLLKGAVIRSGSNTKAGLIVRATLEPTPYEELWKMIGGG